MSILVVLLPARERLSAAATPDGSAARATTEYGFVLSPDGLNLSAQGRCAATLLPRADSVVAVLADADASWHAITLPRAPAAKLRPALIGLLEEALLNDAEATHFALSPDASAGQPSWIAAVDKPWLADQIALLEKSGVPVERVVPSSWPDPQPQGHFSEPPGQAAGAPMRLTWSDAQGVACLRLQGGLARTLLPVWSAQPARWSATPAVAAPAERLLGAPVQVMTDEQRALQAARSLWNLRQFDLAPRHRGTLAFREAMRRFAGPSWRPVRWGLGALVALQIMGLNLWAWHQRAAVEDKKQSMVKLLQATHPQVRAVLDAPTQMLRETDALRAAAGRTGEADLEALLDAAASAWPGDQPPVQTLRFEPGRLTLAAQGWSPPQIDQFRTLLRPAGLAVEASEGRVIISRAQAGRS